MEKGLYQKHRDATLQARDYRQRAEGEASPVTAHDQNIAAIMAEREAAETAEVIERIESARLNARSLIQDLEKIRHRSPHLTLALRHAEDAESRLIRLLGQ